MAPGAGDVPFPRWNLHTCEREGDLKLKRKLKEQRARQERKKTKTKSKYGILTTVRDLFGVTWRIRWTGIPRWFLSGQTGAVS